MDCLNKENSPSNIPFAFSFDPHPFYNPVLFPNNIDYLNKPSKDMDAMGKLSELATQIHPLNIHGIIEEELAYLLPKIGSTNKGHHFHINIDVGLYAPEDLSVKIVNDHLLIEGKHNEFQSHDDDSLSSNFMRLYELPKGCNPDAIVSKLSAYGVLTVLIPKPTDQPKERNVAIQIPGSNEIFVKTQSKSVICDKDKLEEEEVK